MDIDRPKLDPDIIKKEENGLKLNKFTVDRSAVDYLELTPFPVMVDEKNVTLLQTSILQVRRSSSNILKTINFLISNINVGWQIILESGVSVWDRQSLWCKVLKMIVKSELKVKVVGLEVCAQMIKYCAVESNVSMK